MCALHQGNRKRRYSSSSAEDGEVCSSPERLAVGGTGTVQEQLEAACEENALLRSRLKRCELDLENSQSYAQTMREHSELLTAKLQEHRNALTAARNALAAVAPSCSCPRKVNIDHQFMMLTVTAYTWRQYMYYPLGCFFYQCTQLDTTSRTSCGPFTYCIVA